MATGVIAFIVLMTADFVFGLTAINELPKDKAKSILKLIWAFSKYFVFVYLLTNWVFV